jgi:hypothetical protein
LKLIIENLKVNVETKHLKGHEKQPLKTFRSTTKFGYGCDGKAQRFQDYRCRDASLVIE